MANISNMSNPCAAPGVQDVFGPIVAESCLGGFDFTLAFEESILTIGPLGLAMLWLMIRLWVLRTHSIKVHASWLLPLKLTFYIAYGALQVALLVRWTASDLIKTKFTIASISLAIFGSLVLAVGSSFEHRRSLRPSTALVTYLGLSMMFDMARVRTLFQVSETRAIPAMLVSALTLKIVLFVLESIEKKKFLYPEWKNLSPEDTGSIVNRAFFFWLNKTFIQGFKSFLTVNSLVPLDAELLAASRPITLMDKWKKANKSSKHALFLTFLWHYKWCFLAGVVPRLAYTGFSYSQPFLVQRVLDFYDEDEEPQTANIAYGLVSAYAISYIGLSLSYAAYEHKTYRLLTLFRGSLITMIFSKTLKVDSSSISEAEAITLMSADIDRIGSSMTLIHEIYASFAELGLALWLLYRLIGIAMVASIGWIALCTIIGIPLAKAAADAQIPWLEAIEERLAVTAKALSAMKPIKMTGLSDIVGAKISKLRTSEIAASRRHRLLNIFMITSYFSSTALAPVWGFAAYVLIARANHSGTLNEGVAFAVLSIYELLNQPLMYVIDGFEYVQTVLNSFNRIQKYLMSEERMDRRITPETTTTTKSSSEESVADEKTSNPNLSSSSPFEAVVTDVTCKYTEDGEAILNNISFNIPRGKTTMIVGPVGCGKSTALRLLLGEIPFEGIVSTNFTHSAYCPQTAWTTWGDLRSNILGMSKFDQEWYDRIIRACALYLDIQELPEGDKTQTGTRGSRLSGGQQMRMSFARALYSKNPVLVLDDVLTGLDRSTESHILEAVFAPTGLLRERGTTAILATNTEHHLRFADHVICLGEDGTVIRQGPPDSISLSEAEISKQPPKERITVQKEELPEEVLQELDAFDNLDMTKNRHAGDIKIYGYYASVAGWWTIALYLAACVTFVFGITFPSVWIQWWTNANAQDPNQHLGYWLGVYGALAGITILGCALADSVFNMIVLPKTARRFHELLLNTTKNAKISFLTSTDAGTTLNRFSQDLELIDNDLPMAIDSTVFQFLSAIVSAILVFISSGYVAAALPLVIVALCFIQFYYLRTSRQLRLLDIEAKAPLFSQFLESVNGIECIRAYGWSDQYLERSYSTLDRSQKPYYLLWCIQRWLTLVLDLLNAGLAILLVGITTNIRNGSTAFLGVALYNIVTFSSTLQTLVSQWTQVETALGAISRIRAYVMDTKSENLPTETEAVSDDWPVTGTVIFENVSASYEASSQAPVLQGISIEIQPGEKVAICGRTGSGKSSLVSTLLRMLETDSGSIVVDGIDISTIPRQLLRERLNTIPQEPFFLHGSVRENLDPVSGSEDLRLQEALRSVGLWETFEAQGGLDSDLSEDQLSHGQRQLFCLARAVVKGSRLVILDEATSSVDAATDQVMQRILRSEFQGLTLIAIAHKLDTVLDYDRVILLDQGRVVELGNPRELLADGSSRFHQLYHSKQ